MLYSEPDLENETDKLLCDFEIETDNLISTRPSYSQEKEENMLNFGQCCLGGPQSKTNKKAKER